MDDIWNLYAKSMENTFDLFDKYVFKNIIVIPNGIVVNEVSACEHWMILYWCYHRRYPSAASISVKHYSQCETCGDDVMM